MITLSTFCCMSYIGVLRRTERERVAQRLFLVPLLEELGDDTPRQPVRLFPNRIPLGALSSPSGSLVSMEALIVIIAIG